MRTKLNYQSQFDAERCIFNQAVSDLNIPLDGATYPGWKMSRVATQKLFIE